MKSYSLPLLVAAFLGISASLVIAVSSLAKRNQKIFAGKTMLYLLGVALSGALLGTSGYLLDNSTISPTVLYPVLQLLLVSLSGLHFYFLYKINPWAHRERFLPEFLFTILLSLVGALSFALMYQWMEAPEHAPMFATVFCFFPLVFLVAKTYDFWAAIPGKEYFVYVLPVDQDPSTIEWSDQFLNVVFYIPIRHGTPEAAEFQIRSPLNKTLGDLFYYLVYRHNVQEKIDPNIPDIEIAHDDRRDELYGWLFFTKKYYFGHYYLKQYIHPIKAVTSALGTTTTIFLERVHPNLKP